MFYLYIVVSPTESNADQNIVPPPALTCQRNRMPDLPDYSANPTSPAFSEFKYGPVPDSHSAPEKRKIGLHP